MMKLDLVPQPDSGDSPQAYDSAVKRCKKNRHGLITLTNGVVFMKELELSDAVPSKVRNDNKLPLFKTKLSWARFSTS